MTGLICDYGEVAWIVVGCSSSGIGADCRVGDAVFHTGRDIKANSKYCCSTGPCRFAPLPISLRSGPFRTALVVAKHESRRWLRESYPANVEEVGISDVVCCGGSAHGSVSEGERGAESIADADAALRRGGVHEDARCLDPESELSYHVVVAGVDDGSVAAPVTREDLPREGDCRRPVVGT